MIIVFSFGFAPGSRDKTKVNSRIFFVCTTRYPSPTMQRLILSIRNDVRFVFVHIQTTRSINSIRNFKDIVPLVNFLAAPRVGCTAFFDDANPNPVGFRLGGIGETVRWWLDSDRIRWYHRFRTKLSWKVNERSLFFFFFFYCLNYAERVRTSFCVCFLSDFSC